MGLPTYVWTYLYYHNKDMLDEAGVPHPKKGWMVDDYGAALDKLTKKDASGKVTRWGGIENLYSPERIQLWLLMFGGREVDPDDWTHCVISSDQSKAAMEWHRHRPWDTNVLAQAMQVWHLRQESW